MPERPEDADDDAGGQWPDAGRQARQGETPPADFFAEGEDDRRRHERCVARQVKEWLGVPQRVPGQGSQDEDAPRQEQGGQVPGDPDAPRAERPEEGLDARPFDASRGIMAAAMGPNPPSPTRAMYLSGGPAMKPSCARSAGSCKPQVMAKASAK